MVHSEGALRLKAEGNPVPATNIKDSLFGLSFIFAGTAGLTYDID